VITLAPGGIPGLSLNKTAARGRTRKFELSLPPRRLRRRQLRRPSYDNYPKVLIVAGQLWASRSDDSPHATRCVTSEDRNGRPVRAPQLLLRGRWLQHAGFQVGVPVKVHVSRRRLVIEPDCDRATQVEVLARIAQVTEGGLTKRDLDALIRRLKRDRID
jgi:hypothetical protein